MHKTKLSITGLLSILFGGFFIAVNWSVNRDTNNWPFYWLYLFGGMLVLAGLWHLYRAFRE